MKVVTIEIKRSATEFLGSRDWIVTIGMQPEMDFTGPDLRTCLLQAAIIIEEMERSKL